MSVGARVAPPLLVTGGAVANVDVPSVGGGSKRRAIQDILIDRGTFALVGSAGRGIQGSSAKPETLDLSGHLILPGLLDAHNHQQSAASDRLVVATAPVESIEDLLDCVALAAERRERGAWVVTERSMTRAQLREARFPTAAEIDARIPNHPVAIRFGAHAMALNSAALAVSGLAALGSDPTGGVLERSADGELLGPIHEYGAIRFVEAELSSPTEAELIHSLELTIDEYLRVGLTGVRIPGMRPGEFAWYQQLRDRDALRMRVSACVRTDTNASFEQKVATYRSWEVRTGFGDRLLQLDAMKIFVDGGVQPFGSETTEFVDSDELGRLVLEAVGRGWAVTCHAISRPAISRVLDAYAGVRAHGAHGVVLAIEHAFWADQEQLERAARLGVWLSLQPNLVRINAHLIGPREGVAFEPSIDIAHALAIGARVALGSDWNATPGTMERPFSPLLSMAIAVDEGVARDSVLGLHTEQVGLLMGRSDLGRIAPGYAGDLIAFNGPETFEELLSEPATLPSHVIVDGAVVVAP